MKQLARAAGCVFSVLLASACSSEAIDGGGGRPDATESEDGGVVLLDGGVGRDAVVGPPLDAEVRDGGPAPMDSGPAGDAAAMDASPALLPQMEPGDHLQTAEARLELGDTFAEVTQKLGAGTRSASMNARSYEWSLSSGVELTVWFANTNLDSDDDAPNDVDGTDAILWMAVQGGFTGKTSRNVGLGSTRAAVEAAAPAGYGAPPHTVELDNPPGTLAQYFQSGLLVAYEPGGTVRTVTICRAYRVAPDGELKPDDPSLDFGAAGEVRGLRGLSSGTSRDDIVQLLGEPDAQGDVVVAGNSLLLLSYGFIGIEVFLSPATERTYFASVHAPYYGVIQGSSATIGSPRSEVEAALDLGPGVAGANQLVCYEGGGDPDVGVSYSTDPTPVATTFTIPLIRQQGSTTCP